MASYPAPKLAAYKADAAGTKGKAVKIGTDYQHVAECSAASDKILGVLQSTPTAAEDVVEVALPGGGAVALCQTSITAGQLLTAHSDGKWKPVSSGEYYGCQALKDGVAGDLIPVNVITGIY